MFAAATARADADEFGSQAPWPSAWRELEALDNAVTCPICKGGLHTSMCFTSCGHTCEGEEGGGGAGCWHATCRFRGPAFRVLSSLEHLAWGRRGIHMRLHTLDFPETSSPR